MSQWSTRGFKAAQLRKDRASRRMVGKITTAKCLCSEEVDSRVLVNGKPSTNLSLQSTGLITYLQHVHQIGRKLLVRSNKCKITDRRPDSLPQTKKSLRSNQVLF